MVEVGCKDEILKPKLFGDLKFLGEEIRSARGGMM